MHSKAVRNPLVTQGARLIQQTWFAVKGCYMWLDSLDLLHNFWVDNLFNRLL